MELKLLDVCCASGGVSDGFAKEGFDITGIDILDAPALLGYKHKFVQADLRKLNGKDFQKFTVIWGSPPCRDYSSLAFLGQRWKDPPNPERGLELIRCFRKFIDDAQPKFWIMENVWLLCRHYPEKPKMISPLGKRMLRAFWGNFPPFLMPRTNKVLTSRNKSGSGPSHVKVNGKTPKYESAWRARIPDPVSRAFARAIKEALDGKI